MYNPGLMSLQPCLYELCFLGCGYYEETWIWERIMAELLKW